jgi:hypothetical protein
MSLRKAPNIADDQINLRYYIQKADGRLEERQPKPACYPSTRSPLSTPLVWDLVQRADFLCDPNFNEEPIKAEISASLRLFRYALARENFEEQERLRLKLRDLHVRLDRILTLKERARVHPSGIRVEAKDENLLAKCKQAIGCLAAVIKRSC